MARTYASPIFALALLAAGCASRSLDQCKEAYRRGNGVEAADLCVAALERTPRAEVAGMLAWGQQAAGKKAEAQKTLQRFGAGAGSLQLAAAALAWRGGDLAAGSALEKARDACRAERDEHCAVRAELELSSLHYTRGEYRGALAAANRAEESPLLAENSVLAARALTRIFDVLYDLGDAEGAARALGEAKKKPGLDAASLAFVHVKEGNLRNLEGRAALARQAWLLAIDEAGKTGGKLVVWSARLNLVALAARAGQVAEAQAQLAAAEALFAELPKSRTSQLALHLHRALTLHARHELEAALRELDAALSLAPAADWRWELQLERALVLREAGRAEAAMDACGAAIAAVEKMRDELGADELKAWLLPRKRRPYELLFELQAQASRTLPALQTADRALARTFLDAFVEAHQPLESAAPGGEALVRADALRELLPALRRSPVVAPAPIEEVLAALGDRHALVYFTAENGVWLADVKAGKVALRRLPTTLHALQPLIDGFVAAPGDRASAEALGAILVPGGLLRAGEVVYLVSAAPLSDVPFAALLRPSGKALVEEHELHSAPSLSALAAIARAAPEASSAAVVLADAQGDLPAARAEAGAVGEALSVRPLVGAEASLQAVRGAGRASVLHLAVHGGVGLPGAWLELSDGKLLASDVLAQRLRPRLVVLSACASAAARSRETWGSLSSAFLAAGSRAVIASLWSVEDAATRALAERFYAEGGARSPALALARAQRTLLARGAPASSWAAFIAVGE